MERQPTHQITSFLTEEQLRAVEALADRREWHRSHAVRHLVQLGIEAQARRDRSRPVENREEP